MYGGSVGIVAICALGATALVTPPRSAPNVHGEDFRPAVLHPTTRHRITVPCHSCDLSLVDDDLDYDDLSENDEDLPWTQSSDQDVALDFSVSKDGRRLQLDGEPIFPSKFFRSSAHGGRPIYITQPSIDSSAFTSFERQRLPLEVTSFGIVVSESRGFPGDSETVAKDGNQVLRVQLRITSLEKQPANVDEVIIHLLRTRKGKLVITNLTPVPRVEDLPLTLPPSTLASPPVKMTDSECARLPAAVCRLRQAVEERLEALRHSKLSFPRPCPEMHGPPDMGPKFSEFDVAGPPPHHHGHPPPFGPPHHFGPPPPPGFHLHGHHPHHFLHALARGAIAILIPVMAGITTGLLVSLVGLMVGRVIGFIWVKITGRTEQPASSCRCNPSFMHRHTEEGKMLLGEADEADPPPVYEDAPAYTELESHIEVSGR